MPRKFSKPDSPRKMMAYNRAIARAKKGGLVESPLKPTDRPSKKKTDYESATSVPKDPGNKGSGFFPGIRQGNTMWVVPQKDPKTGKVIRKGFLAWRNNFERAYIKDKVTGKDRLVRRGDRVTGNVRIEKPGTTYADKTTATTRGGTHRDPQAKKSYDLGRYVAGRNVNSPSMKKKLAQNFVSASKRERNPKKK